MTAVTTIEDIEGTCDSCKRQARIRLIGDGRVETYCGGHGFDKMNARMEWVERIEQRRLRNGKQYA